MHLSTHPCFCNINGRWAKLDGHGWFSRFQNWHWNCASSGEVQSRSPWKNQVTQPPLLEPLTEDDQTNIRARLRLKITKHNIFCVCVKEGGGVHIHLMRESEVTPCWSASRVHNWSFWNIKTKIINRPTFFFFVGYKTDPAILSSNSQIYAEFFIHAK